MSLIKWIFSKFRTFKMHPEPPGTSPAGPPGARNRTPAGFLRANHRHETTKPVPEEVTNTHPTQSRQERHWQRTGHRAHPCRGREGDLPPPSRPQLQSQARTLLRNRMSRIWFKIQKTFTWLFTSPTTYAVAGGIVLFSLIQPPFLLVLILPFGAVLLAQMLYRIFKYAQSQ